MAAGIIHGFLRKKEKEYNAWWEQQQIKEKEKFELRQSLKSVPKGILKLKSSLLILISCKR